MYGVVAAFVLLLGACGADEPAEVETVEEDVEERGMAVDKGLLNVEVTIPAMFFEDEDIDETIREAKENGVRDVLKNEDGSVTYKMSKAQHKAMLNEMQKGATEYITELEEDEELSSIHKISHNKNLSEFTLEVEREAFENSFDGFAILGIGLTGMYYQVFEGTDADKIKVVMHLKDIDTNEVYNSIVYPDDLGDEEDGADES